ncbi:MAG: hypothetical protein R3C62_02055 [Chloroflexota bacterium]
MQTVEAIIDKNGVVKLLKPVQLSSPRQALVTILDAPRDKEPRPYGLCAGEFVVPGDFDEALPEDILTTFEGE